MGEDERLRVGILGAGAAGLSCAWYLKKAGYEDVVVLESASEPGGLCYDVEIGGECYDLGAVFAVDSFQSLRQLLDEAGGALGERTGGFPPIVDGHSEPPFAGPAILGPIEERLAAIDLDTGYNSLSDPGFAGLHPDLWLSFSEFVKKYDLPDLRRLLEPFVTGFGYGYFDETPTAYVLKYMDKETRHGCFATGEVRYLEGGFGSFFRRLASDFDVRCDQQVLAIESAPGSPPRVRTASGSSLFDAVVITFPPTGGVVPTHYDETARAHLARVQTVEYMTCLVEAPGYKGRSAVFPQNFESKRRGRVHVIVRPDKEREMLMVYTVVDGKSDAEVKSILREDLLALGVENPVFVAQRRVHFFPHLPPGADAAGFYDWLESAQGIAGVYVAGALCNFSSVDGVVEYSRSLVERHFQAEH